MSEKILYQFCPPSLPYQTISQLFQHIQSHLFAALIIHIPTSSTAWSFFQQRIRGVHSFLSLENSFVVPFLPTRSSAPICFRANTPRSPHHIHYACAAMSERSAACWMKIYTKTRSWVLGGSPTLSSSLSYYKDAQHIRPSFQLSPWTNNGIYIDSNSSRSGADEYLISNVWLLWYLPGQCLRPSRLRWRRRCL